MKTFCIFSANYPSHVGGVECYTQKIANELSRRGNNVYVITSALEGIPDTEQVNENFRIIRLPSIHLIDGRMPVLRMTDRWRETRRMLSELDHPCVIIQTFLYPLSLAAARLAREKGWPFFVINHGCNYVCQGNGLIDKAEHLYEEVIARLVMHKSSGCYAVSRAAGEWVKHFGASFSGVLSNAIDVQDMLDRLNQLPGGVRKIYGIGEHTTLVSYVGRLIPEKGVVQLVKAVQRLWDEGHDIALIAAGGGALYDELKQQENDRIHIIGSTLHDDVLRLLRESDCCCLPSDSEGFPTVLLEAALCKCYAIGSPFGGIPEAIGEYGTIMPGNTCEHIHHALTEFMQTDTDEMVENAYERVINAFSWENTCDGIEALVCNER